MTADGFRRVVKCHLRRIRDAVLTVRAEDATKKGLYDTRKAALAVLIAFAGPVAAFDICAVVDIDRVGFERNEAVKNVDGAHWWIEMGGDLLLCGHADLITEAHDLGHGIDRIYHDIDPTRIRLIRGESNDREWDHLVQSLLRHRRLEVIQLQQANQTEMTALLGHSKIEPLPLPVTVIRQAENSPQKTTRHFGESTQTLVDEVDQARWFSDLETLASYNRYSYGDGIFDAENWIVQQLTAMPGMTVTTPGFSMGGREVHNVVGTLVGTARPDEWYIVGAHYDSTSENPQAAAPGAEDNASGCAGVLEMARIFSANPPHASVLFICYVGEEQGLLGSIDHASDLVSTGDSSRVQAMLNMDMIGFTSDSDLDCLLESESIGQFLIDAFSAAATTYTTLRIETTLFAWGSDHVPYLDRSIPALLTIENDWADYPDYHETGDLPNNITLAMGREILKMNVATLAEMAGGDSALIFIDGFESGNLGRWTE